MPPKTKTERVTSAAIFQSRQKQQERHRVRDLQKPAEATEIDQNGPTCKTFLKLQQENRRTTTITEAGEPSLQSKPQEDKEFWKKHISSRQEGFEVRGNQATDKKYRRKVSPDQ